MYKYEEMKKEVFTEDGYKTIVKIKRNIQNRECFNTTELIKNCSGDSWVMLACVDWLVESGEIELVSEKGSRNHWVYRRR